jgi:hypothetical protein
MISNALDISAVLDESAVKSSDFEWFDLAGDPNGWNALVWQRASLFHLGPVLAAHAFGAAVPRGILLCGAGDAPVPIGGLVRESGGAKSFSSLSFPSLEATGDAGLVESLTEWLFAEGFNSIEIGSFDGGAEGYRLPEHVSVRERLEFVWDLRESAQQRLRALNSNHKRKLQKLRKRDDLELREIGGLQPELLTWLRVQWARRRERAPGLRQILEMYGYHRFLHTRLTRQGVGHLYGIYDADNTLLSAAYMLETGDSAFYMIGASSPAGYQLNASLRLFWDLAERYQSRGVRRLHFGGVPAAALEESHDEHGVLRFKAGFGIEPARRLSLSIRK